MIQNYIPEPQILGRFCYFSYKKDLYNIVFIPFDGVANMTIAKNLLRKEMTELIQALNNELDITFGRIKEGNLEEEITEEVGGGSEE